MPRFDGEVFLFGTAIVLLRCSVKRPLPPLEKRASHRGRKPGKLRAYTLKRRF
jgi:hypothetical protein